MKPSHSQTKISVVICTKDRSKDLSDCLASIRAMHKLPDELVVIDNHSTDETPQVVRQFQHSVNFPVRYIMEKKAGYPAVYNRGLSESKHNWVIFIDDDCIAGKQWLDSLCLAIEQSKNVAAVLGQSDTLYRTNLFSLATMFNIWYWKKQAIIGSRILDLEVLDNKNIVYNKTFLQNHLIRFDDERNKGWEDCDVGMQIQRAGGKAIYASRALVFHKDPTTLGSYLKKVYNSALEEISYRKGWDAFRQSHGLKRFKSHAYANIPIFTKRYHLSFVWTAALVLILYLTYGYIKIVTARHK
jgi:glycosyltransferase involved in cell wall biosynthesis